MESAGPSRVCRLPSYWRPHESYDDAAWERASDAELSLFENVKDGRLDATTVYIIAGRPDGAVKIGITQQPDRRLRAIQAGMAQVFRAPLWFHEYYVFRTLAGARDIEQRAHAALYDLRLPVGEWFMCPPEQADRTVWGCVLQDAFPDDWQDRL